MSRHQITDTEIRALENNARRLRAETFRSAGLAIAAWVRGLFAGAAAPKGGRTA
jgi:hypothetical protein